MNSQDIHGKTQVRQRFTLFRPNSDIPESKMRNTPFPSPIQYAEKSFEYEARYKMEMKFK